MIKKYFLLSFFLFFVVGFTRAQNLVPNPSFEDTASCPTNQSQCSKALGWSSYRDTPDYFNDCAPNGNNASVPNNLYGFQIPFSGDAYMGVQCYSGANYREYFGAQLYTPLIVGQKYFATFHIVAAIGGGLGAYGYCNKMGLKFSTTQFSQTNPYPVNNTSVVYSLPIVSDTTNWITIRGSFIADSAYKYVIIGNFFDNLNTDTTQIISGYERAIYMFDDICVTTDTNTCNIPFDIANLMESKSTFEIYPNPANYFINIIVDTIKPINIEILNELGNVLIGKQNIFSNTIIELSSLNSGLYIIRAEIGDDILFKKLIITH